MGHFAEAAAVAHHAVSCCARDAAVRPGVHAAAHHNLAVALASAGELAPALSAYENALRLLPDDHPSRANIEAAADDVRVRVDGVDAAKQLAVKVRPGVIAQTTKVLRKHQSLPPIAGQPRSASAAPPADGSRSVGAMYQHPVPYPRTQLQRIRHAKQVLQERRMSPPRRALTPKPLLTMSMSVSTALTVTPSETSKAAAAKPLQHAKAWNFDTSPDALRSSSEPNALPTNPDIELRTAERYIPRRIHPIVEDLRYKEATRRVAVAKEWRRQLRLLQHLMGMHLILSAEDQRRAELETDEVRVRRVLQQWVRGKLLFAEGSLECEAAETASRGDITTEAAAETQQRFVPHAQMVRLLAVEEGARSTAVAAGEAAARQQLALRCETQLAGLTSADAFRQSQHGIAVALATWALETVIEASMAVDLIDPKDRKSLYVMDRYSLFGLPGGAEIPPTSVNRRRVGTPPPRTN
jgi:hypothetical protein